MSYIVTENSVTVFHGKPYTLSRSAANDNQWQEVLDHLSNGNTAAAVKAMDTASAINEYFDGEIGVVNGQVAYQGRVIDTYPAQRAIDFMRQGLPYRALLAFIKRLEHNPSYRAVQDLYQFLEKSQMPLTDDGHFIAYKKVRRRGDKLVDIHSGTFDNSVGSRVEMPRNQVDEDPDRTCSRGLHVCAYSYLSCFGSGSADAVIACKIDPADVVAIPVDYNNAKMRVCAYEVVEELEGISDDILRGMGIYRSDALPTSSWISWDPENDDATPPYDDDTMVVVRFRNNNTDVDTLDHYYWHHDGGGNDIIAYRVLDETEWENEDANTDDEGNERFWP